MIIFNILTIFIGIATIIANIWIARYNIGKNRIIYSTEEITIHTNQKDCFKKLNAKLSTGTYTILTTYQDARNTRNNIYVVGEVNT